MRRILGGCHLLRSSTISISVVLESGPARDEVRTSPPAAKESMSIAKREVVMLGSWNMFRGEGVEGKQWSSLCGSPRGRP